MKAAILVSLLIVAVIGALVEVWRQAHQRGYDAGKVDGLAEGWKHWPDRDSHGRFKPKAKDAAP